MSKPLHEKPLQVLGNNGAAIAFNDQEGQTSVTTTTGVSAGAVHYIPIPISDSAVNAVQLRWHDGTVAVSAATLEVCNLPKRLISDVDTDLDNWTTESAVSITGPAGSAAGSEMIDISSIGSRRGRIKLTISANGPISAWPWSK